MAKMVRILLHRPFVSDGHLSSIAPEVAKSSFSACATAATEIVQIIRLYDQTFTIRRAPYLISYATYLAATIHVRIAARRQAWSEAHSCLQTCLAVFEQNSETNHAVRKASVVIENLMKRMAVSIQRQNSLSGTGGSTEQDALFRSADTMQSQRGQVSKDYNWTGSDMEPAFTQSGFADDIDIDAIIESFVQNQQMVGYVGAVDRTAEQSGLDLNMGSQYDAQFAWSDSTNGIDDTLFGFHTSGLNGLR